MLPIIDIDTRSKIAITSKIYNLNATEPEKSGQRDYRFFYFYRRVLMIIRIKKDIANPYVMINKELLNDTNLSWKAKGLLSYMLSLPDDWDFYLKDLKNRSKDGRISTASAIKELEQSGYLKRKRLYENGKLSGIQYTIYEKTILKSGNLIEGFLTEENKPLLISNVTDNELTNITVSENTKTEKTNKNNKELGELIGLFKSRYEYISKGKKIVIANKEAGQLNTLLKKYGLDDIKERLKFLEWNVLHNQFNSHFTVDHFVRHYEKFVEVRDQYDK